jgi:hypothetical protein
MDRRRFLTLGLLSGTALAGSSKAWALTRESCDVYPNTAPCREVMRHKALIVDLEKALAKRGLSPAQIQTAMARAVCPYCGQLLLG